MFKKSKKKKKKLINIKCKIKFEKIEKKHDLFSVFPGISVCDNDVFPTISSLLI